MSAARDLANDLGDESLENRLEKAGIKPHGKSADDVLARLKKKAEG